MLKTSAPGTSKRTDYNFDYRIIGFALLNNIRLDDHPLVKSLFRRRSVFICEHPLEDDSTCEYKTLHYHGIVELPKGGRFDNDRVVLDIKKIVPFLNPKKPLPQLTF